MTSQTTAEIASLLTKLYTLQEDVGAKSKTTDLEKQQKAAASSSLGMGQSRGAKKAGSRFLELKSAIIERLQSVHQLMEQVAQRSSGKTSVAQGNNPKEIIAAQAQIREQIRQLGEEWDELNALYSNEAKKRRSRFSKEELEIQNSLVMKLQSEITKVKNAQMKGYGRGGTDVATALNTRALADLDATPLFAAPSGGGATSWAGNNGPSPTVDPGVPLTENQRMQIQQLEERDADFDNQLNTISEGLTDLGELAEMLGEETRRQVPMMENLGNRIDGVHEHVTNVNVKMKETLKEVGRSSDKICVDIMCIVMMLGFGAVIYNIAKSV